MTPTAAQKLNQPKKQVIEYLIGRKDGIKRPIGRLPNTFRSTPKGDFVDCQLWVSGSMRIQTIDASRIQKIVVGEQ